MSVTDQQITEAEAIRQRHDDAQGRIASRADLSAEAKQSLSAQAYLDAKQAMTDLQAAAIGDDETRRRQLSGRLFGLDGITGDPVAAAVSLRDAQDRAVQLDTPEAASAALQLAEDSGDQIQARAIFQRAYIQSQAPFGAAWGDVLYAYCDARPQAANDLNELHDITRPTAGAAAMFAFVLVRPPGLPPGSDWALQQLADDGRFAGLQQ